MREPRKRTASPKTSLVVSLVFHVVLILVAFVFAAREGVLGKKLRELTILIASEPKKPEPPKEKPPEPAKETPTPVVAAPAKVAPAIVSAPPPETGPAVAAPPAANLPSFDFSDGARAVGTTSNQNGLYKAQVEFSLRSHWNRPDAPNDEKYVAEVQLDMAADGRIVSWTWVKGSGDARWDDSVRDALKATQDIGRPRPKNFPEQFLVRFDVQASEAADAIQLDLK